MGEANEITEGVVSRLEYLMTAVRGMRIKREFETDLMVAIYSTKKQIAKKVIRKNLTESFKCPHCYSDKYYKEDAWCRECGQKLDWEV